jgi:hypothetical protein
MSFRSTLRLGSSRPGLKSARKSDLRRLAYPAHQQQPCTIGLDLGRHPLYKALRLERCTLEDGYS